MDGCTVQLDTHAVFSGDERCSNADHLMLRTGSVMDVLAESLFVH